MKPTFLTLTAFPNSQAEPFEITSRETGDYNCIGWAVGDSTKFYWPGPSEFFFWPNEIPRNESLETFQLFFNSLVTKSVPTASWKRAFKKSRFLKKNGLPTHAARQLADGFWTSKLDVLEDVKHSLGAISGGFYGEIALFLRKNARFEESSN